VWTWDGVELVTQPLAPGRHSVVATGLDRADHPRVAHFADALAALPAAGPERWEAWRGLLAGGGVDPADERALLVRVEHEGRTFTSSSASLVALRPGAARFAFGAPPGPEASWSEVRL
jgi:hypothetical protein